MEKKDFEAISKLKFLKLSFIMHIFTIIMLIILSFLIFLNRQAVYNLNKTLKEDYVDKGFYEKLKLNIPNAIGITPNNLPADGTPDSSPLMAYEPVTYMGTIKKEKIPEEYNLGEYWYIFYFDTPQMIETVAGDMYKDSLEIQPSELESLEPFLNQEVTVKGRLSYGYAESRVILVDSIISY